MKARHARRVGLPHALALAVVLLASLAAGGGAIGATTAPTFARADYGLFRNNYALGDFNGDGSLDLAGAGGPVAKVRSLLLRIKPFRVTREWLRAALAVVWHVGRTRVMVF
jgi:hypothetical protein